MIPSLFAAIRRLRLRAAASVDGRPIVLGAVLVRGAGRVTVGDGVRFEATVAPIELHAGERAEIVLGRGAVVEAGCSIEALRSVRIGEGARLGAFVKILDNHFHSRAGDRNSRPPSAPVIVEENAVIGPHAVLLPGAHIGRGARIGAGAVVSRRVPPFADVHGLPLVARARRA
jgi:acetyltransferase-like isoleucine patch superfamily enzyme